jgi:carbon-monoxide dehydrogenase medium subunit
MIPVGFDYVKAGSVAEAVSLLTEHGDDAKLLAGGHSLLPLMKLRMAAPSVLVDVGPLSGELSYVRHEGGELRIGALTRHKDVGDSAVLREHAPLLADVAGQIGDPQVRHRGTIGGAIAHGDPASDLPAALLALRATLVAQGPGGERLIPVDELFTGFLETALAADEILTEVRVPVVPAGSGWSFQEFNRRAQDWAIVAVAAVVSRNGSTSSGVGLVNMGAVPLRATAVEQALAGGASVDDAAAQADQGTDPPDDINASPDFRRHLSHVLVRRALQAAGM